MTGYLLAVMLLLSCSAGAEAGLRSKVNKGNDYFNRQEYGRASEKYRDALISDPESGELHFNLGNTLYRDENYEEAMKEFEKSTYSRDIELQSKAYYNMGNCLYSMNKLPESIQFYKKALELNPEDEDAKYNIEYVQRKIKENMDKNKEQQKEGQQEQQQGQQQQQQGQQEQDKDGKDREKQKQQEKGEEKEEQQQQQQQQAQEKEEGMSKEDAERLLQAFEEDEKEAQKKRRMQAPAQGRVEYEW